MQEERFKGYNMEVHNELSKKIEVLKSRGMSQNAISNKMGISSAALSSYLSGAYPNPETIEFKIRTFLERNEREQEKLEVNYVSIKATPYIVQAINACQRDKDFAVIVGHTGTSKTWTIKKKYLPENPSAIYIKCNKSAVGQLLRMIAVSLKIDIKGNSSSLYEKIINNVRNKDYVLIVDEADYLNEKCLQMLRNISDDGNIGVALVGLPRLVETISKQDEDYQQLLRRVGTYLDLRTIGKYDLSDAEKIVKDCFPDAKKELIEKFYFTSKGCIGTLTKLIEKSFEIAKNNNRVMVEPEDIERSKEVILRTIIM